MKDAGVEAAARAFQNCTHVWQSVLCVDCCAKAIAAHTEAALVADRMARHDAEIRT